MSKVPSDFRLFNYQVKNISQKIDHYFKRLRSRDQAVDPGSLEDVIAFRHQVKQLEEQLVELEIYSHNKSMNPG